MYNLSAFRAKAKRNHPRLKKFLRKFNRKFIPNMLPTQLAINAEVWQEVDCLQCANCCKTMTPTYTPADLKRISTHLGMSKKELFAAYLMIDKDNGDTVNRSTPCQWLNATDNKCSIYDVRPEDCAGFPHHTKTKFDDYNHVYEQNLDKCPATYKLIEKMEKWVEGNFEW
jgi:uncharacterized protein